MSSPSKIELAMWFMTFMIPTPHSCHSWWLKPRKKMGTYIPHKDYLVPWLPGSGKYGEQPHSSVGSLVVECGDFGFLNFWVAMENGNVKWGYLYRTPLFTSAANESPHDMSKHNKDLDWLVVWLPFFIFPYIGLLIIPIDFHIFQRGGPTTNQ